MSTPTKNLTPSLVRTLVPLIVGYVVSLAARHGWHINDDQAASTITAVVSYLYYALVRVLEAHVSGKFGVLLGLRRQPSYSDSSSAASI